MKTMDKLEKKLKRLSKIHDFEYSLFYDSSNVYDCKTLRSWYWKSKIIKWIYDKYIYFDLYNYSKNDYSSKKDIDYFLSFIS
jgi:hypothetical protein